MGSGWLGVMGAAVLVSGAVPSAAQVRVAGDPFASDPTGIVADPCPAHPKVSWTEQQLHTLTRDFGQLCRYRAANAALTERPRVVFAGDSITDNWINFDPAFFSNGVIDRGIGGQTSPQNQHMRYRAHGRRRYSADFSIRPANRWAAIGHR